MIILDVNILLYAYNQDDPRHSAAIRWLTGLFNGPELIGLPWPTLWGFLRISTSPRFRRETNAASTIFQNVRDWLAQPGVIVVHPGSRHLELLEQLVVEDRAAGPLVSDATLASLAIENGAILASTDKDFSRFSGLHWTNPLA
ncbi:MAG: PIN domain-containing protein [Acidobacteriaceae bacterium]|nr:PIN domain-containing protein [Acidobacteriaceae bacterium]